MNYQLLNSKFIFIHYAAGAFGSTLYNLIYCSDDCLKYNEFDYNIFTEKNNAHKNLFETIKNFHTKKEIDYWLNLKQIDKIDFLHQNLNENFKFSNLYQPPVRLPDYTAIADLSKLFVNSKTIIITFEKHHIEFLKKIYLEKIQKFYGPFFDEKTSKFFNHTKNKKYSEYIIDKHATISMKYFYKKQNQTVFLPDYFIFPIDSFFNKSSFEIQINNLYKFLNITQDKINIQKFYDKFYDVNRKYFQFYEKYKLSYCNEMN